MKKITRIGLTAILLTSSASWADAEVVEAGLCNQNKIILKTRDNWYATGIYVDGYRLIQGDVVKNTEINLQIENRLELADKPKAGNYFITSISETLKEAEAKACN